MRNIKKSFERGDWSLTFLRRRQGRCFSPKNDTTQPSDRREMCAIFLRGHKKCNVKCRGS